MAMEPSHPRRLEKNTNTFTHSFLAIIVRGRLTSALMPSPAELLMPIPGSVLHYDAVVDLGDARRGPGGGHRFVVLSPRAHRSGQDHRPVGRGIDGQLLRVQL